MIDLVDQSHLIASSGRETVWQQNKWIFTATGMMPPIPIWATRYYSSGVPTTRLAGTEKLLALNLKPFYSWSCMKPIDQKFGSLMLSRFLWSYSTKKHLPGPEPGR